MRAILPPQAARAYMPSLSFPKFPIRDEVGRSFESIKLDAEFSVTGAQLKH